MLVSDKLGSYAATKAEIIPPEIEQRQNKGLNSRAEVSHWHTRRREKIMGCFKSLHQTQRFLSAHDQIAMRGLARSTCGPNMPRIRPLANRDGGS